MQLKELSLDKDENLETVTVTMTIQEALWIARVSGQQKGESPHSGIFDCLVGAVFDRFWDDGVNDASKDFNFEIPPIKYED